GLAIARHLACAAPSRRGAIVLLDAERDIGQHISSRNSEVIHAGIYYPRDSLKARLCVRGKALLYDYCRRHEIPHRRLGKLIVAQEGETQQLERLRQQALANGVDDLSLLDGRELATRAPAIRAAAALLSPSTGIIDSHSYMRCLLTEAQQAGLLYAGGTHVERVVYRRDDIEVHTRTPGDPAGAAFAFRCRRFINCAGLQAQALAARIEDSDQAAVPPLYLCKGDYFSYSGAAPFSQLVYPLPDSNTRGLGIHSTLDLGGQIRFGPDSEYVERLDYDVDADKRQVFARAIARYFPGIDADKLHPAYAGIRPKLVGPDSPPADFVIQCTPASGGADLVQLFGIESPGLTASLAIAEYVGENLASD
ncbi:MAG: NAD(P)/FAD-dependent oxidoreductase, partial [Pseudohongiellaceae bacterium]